MYLIMYGGDHISEGFKLSKFFCLEVKLLFLHFDILHYHNIAKAASN
jgi:hypothetical protein